MVRLAQTTGLAYVNKWFTVSIQFIRAPLLTVTMYLYIKYTNLSIMPLPAHTTENERQLQK